MRTLKKGKLFFALAALLFLPSLAGAKPIKTLIVTGQNNHNWQVSCVALKEILENSRLFKVDIAISPEKGADMSEFLPDFASYQLVVLDYNGDEWPEPTKQRFVEYAQAGGGIVVYHAADNAFPNWYEYNKIIGLGGWEGRDENSGPYMYYHNGQLTVDSSPGPGGSHGQQHEYMMMARDDRHPIIAGLPNRWAHAQDELYDRMRGPGKIGTVLFTAFSDKETGGSGREEPLLFTVDYGKARIFHTMLGHCGPTIDNNPAMQCTGFQVTLLRGAEWAATGKVKQKVPADFPNSAFVTYRYDYIDKTKRK